MLVARDTGAKKEIKKLCFPCFYILVGKVDNKQDKKLSV